MYKKIYICFYLLLFLMGAVSFSFSQKFSKEDLLPKYKEWLNRVHYIILPQEKEVFFQLTNNRERDIFIKSFWNQRDPTPGTPQNEYKEKILQRFHYANNKLGRGTSQPGWKTDMGRIYILLGPPHQKEDFSGTLGLNNCEVWYYYGDASKGLPTYFALIFYQKEGAGEYKLYHPVSDGPVSLLENPSSRDYSEPKEVYKEIMKEAPTLAPLTLSPIPGEIPYNFQPSLSTNLLFAKINNSPKKDVNPTYADHFLDYKGLVTTEYMTNFLENKAKVAVIKDPIQNIDFVHFSLMPESISVDYFEPKNQYYCNFSLDVSLRQGEEVIYQYSKDLPFYFSPQKTKNIKSAGVAIQDSFPVAEGHYHLTVLYKNSVGKEFSIYEKDIEVKDNESNSVIFTPIIGYKIEDYKKDFHTAFKVMNKRLFTEPDDTYSLSDKVSIVLNIAGISQNLWQNGKMRVSIQGLKKEKPSQKNFFLKLNRYTYSNILNIFHSLPAEELSPDYYEIKFQLTDGKGKILAEKKSNFIISPESKINHPFTIAKSFPLSKRFMYLYALGRQFENLKNFSKANRTYQKAYNLNPHYKEGILIYSNFLIKAGQFDKSLTLIEKLKNETEMSFDYYLLKGKAYMGKGEYEKAIGNFLKGNKIYNSDTELLNGLGYCFYKNGQKEQALEVLKSSLRLNPDQKHISQLIDTITQK